MENINNIFLDIKLRRGYLTLESYQPLEIRCEYNEHQS